MRSQLGYCLAIFALLSALNVVGQDENRRDKYKSRKLSSYQRAAPLLDDAEAQKTADPSAALSKVQEALAISIANEDRASEARCYRLLGEINSQIEEWKLAAENFQLAYDILGKSKTRYPDYVKCVQGLASAYLELGQYNLAQQFDQEAITLARTDDERNEARLQLAEAYYRAGDYPNAERALGEIHTAAGSPVDNRMQNLKARIYARSNSLDKTKPIYQNSVNTLRSAKMPSPQEQQSLNEAKEEIAAVLQEQQKYDDEIAIRQQAIDYNIGTNNLAEVTEDKVAIGKALSKKGDDAAALRELQSAEKIADTLKDPAAQSKAYLALAEAYQKAGRSGQALNTYQKYSRAVEREQEQRRIRVEEKSELIRKQRDIEALSKDVSIGQREETIAQQTVGQQRLLIYGLLLIILIIAVTSYFIYRSAQASKVANQLLALKSLRSQMNPHFIFNALNSVNHFIAQQDERAANRFLSEFSQLMRLVLESSQEDFIPLAREQELLTLYLKLEHYRFRDKFDYTIHMDEQLPVDAIQIPPMLIQPYIENAVWHGLRYKESKGLLTLNFEAVKGGLLVTVSDDGIGRARSAALKTAHQKNHRSTGLKNISERVAILNKVYRSHYHVAVEDIPAGGTAVRIFIPQSHQK